MLVLLIPGLLMGGGSTAAAATVFTFTVQATDSQGITGTRTYVWTIIGLKTSSFTVRATDNAGAWAEVPLTLTVRG